MALRDRLDRLRAQVDARAKQAVPGLALARVDGGALRAWMRYRGAIEQGIGGAEADAYTKLVVDVARRDGDLARVVALTVPDHLARVRADRRPAYFRTLGEVLAVRPAALPLVARTLPDLVGAMDDAALRAFVARGLALHEGSAQKAESFLRQESGVAQAAARELRKGVALAEVQRTLALYARAHCGEDVQVRPGQGRAFSDGHHVYLPEVVDRFGDDRDFLVYRVQTALSAGYLEFGTFDLRLDRVEGGWPDAREGEGEIERYFRAFSNRSLARDLFQVLEDARVERRIRIAYPGVARDLDRLGVELRGPSTEPTAPTMRVIEALNRRARGLPDLTLSERESVAAAPLLAALADVDAMDVNDVARVVSRGFAGVEALMRHDEPGTPRQPDGGGRRAGMRGDGDEQGAFEPPPLAPRIAPEEAGADERRIEREAQRLVKQMEESGEQLEPGAARRAVREAERREREEGTRFEQMEGFIERNAQPGGALVDPSRAEEREMRAAQGVAQDPDTQGAARAFTYREWDATIDDYKPRWVTVREQRLKEGSRQFVDDVMQRRRFAIDALRKRFEALRPQGMVRVRNLQDGQDLDIDRVIESEVNARAGGERLDRVYTRDHRERRDVAVAFLLDMSSSTNEAAEAGGRRIIEVEKEALIVAAEALHALGDPFAVWGFSGYGRDHVAFYVAKEFAEPYDHRARERIGRIGFKMENRDGAAIRHATAKLMAWPARARLLILLSDGKPLDCGCDHYFDRYAQEDTRVALREARKAGVHPFCITVDPTGPQYLARMYGEVAYTVIDRVESLPARLVSVYKRLAL
jgi:nitric oxide reductase activation protein